MNSTWHKIKLGFLLFLFVFGIPLTGFPLNTAKIAVILLGIGVVRRARARKALGRLVRSKINLAVLFFLTFLAVYSAWWPTVLGTGDYELSYVYVVFIVERVVGAMLFVAYASSFRLGLKEYLDLIIWVLVIQAIIVVVMFLSPGIREALWAINARENLAELSARYGGIRGLGLAGGVAYTLSVLMSIGILTVVYVASRYGWSAWYVCAAILMLVGVFFSGRTGWFGVGLAFFLYLYLNNLYDYLMSVKGVILKMVPMAVGLGFLVYNYIDSETLFIVNEYLIPFAFELFINLFEKGSLTASSFETTQGMYFYVHELTFWFGDGRWVSLPGKSYSYYMNTDAGYMRHMLFYGAVVSMILYLVYIMMAVYHMKRGRAIMGGRFGVFVVSVFLVFFVVHWKGDFMGGGNMNIKVLLILHNIVVLAGVSTFALAREASDCKNIA